MIARLVSAGRATAISALPFHTSSQNRHLVHQILHSWARNTVASHYQLYDRIFEHFAQCWFAVAADTLWHLVLCSSRNHYPLRVCDKDVKIGVSVTGTYSVPN